MPTIEHPPPATTRAFDSLAYAKRMEAVGFTRQQAEAMAEEQAKTIDERLATKADIASLHSDIETLRLTTKSDIEALRLATKTDIAALKADIEALRISTKADLDTGLAKIRADLTAAMARNKSDIITWVAGLMIAQGGLIVGLLKLHG